MGHSPIVRGDESSRARRGESGWVLIATLILTSVVASITVGWARHAVLSKGQLEYGSGASRTEEASRSGFDRTREKMRRGNPPGLEEDGEEDRVMTDDGDEVVSERKPKDNQNNRREVKVRVEHESGNESRSANLRGDAEIVPGSRGGGKRTRLKCDEGAKVNLIPGLTMITGEVVFTPSSDLSGVFLMEAGSRMVMEDCTLTGTILTRASLCPDNDLAEGSQRPEIEIRGGFNCRPGSDLPGLSICGPDARLIADSNCRFDIEGMVVAEEVDLNCRGVLRGMLVAEGEESIGGQVERPGHQRGPKNFPDFVDVGSERMTRIAFPSEEFTDAELDAVEDYDVLSHL
jgi:hypothetical protein